MLKCLNRAAHVLALCTFLTSYPINSMNKSALAQALGRVHMVRTLASGFIVFKEINSFHTEHWLAC